MTRRATAVERWADLLTAARRIYDVFLREVRPIEHRSPLQPDGYLAYLKDGWVSQRYPYMLETGVAAAEALTTVARTQHALAMALVV
ncbi:MAG: hypothetical protein OJF50_006422 [Nitrospira sp.]|jgi:hypothetical protein|nr:hypothetical protein [Nitrospira sp.]